MENSDYKEKRKHEMGIRPLSWRDYRLAAKLLGSEILGLCFIFISQNPLIFLLSVLATGVLQFTCFVLPFALIILPMITLSRVPLTHVFRPSYLAYLFTHFIALGFLAFLFPLVIFAAFDGYQHKDTIVFDEHVYYLAHHLDFDFGMYYVFICDGVGIVCPEKIALNPWLEEGSLRISKNGNTIEVMDRDEVIFTYTPETAEAQ